MSVREAAARGRRAAEIHFEDRLWRAVPRTWQRTWEPGDERIRSSAPLAGTPLGFLGHARSAGAAEPREVAQLIEVAETALVRNVRFFGYPAVSVGENEFSRDPFTGNLWPAKHGKLLDYRVAGHGDPKWIWELNRLQHLPLLCAASLLSGDERFADAAGRQAVGWVEASRPPYGIMWSNGFEAALRGISLALTFDALRGAPVIDDGDRALLLRGLWQHARWIARDPSIGSSANNHLLGEAAGLVTIGLLAPELSEAEAWVKRGLAVLEREAPRQILPDGAGAEQAFAYHLFVCDLFLLCAALLQARGRAVPGWLQSALARSGDAIALQVRPGEPDPAYGDADDGRAFILDAEDLREAPAVAASIACALGHSATASLAGKPDLPALLLFGAEGARRFPSGVAEPPASGVLPDAGIVVLRRAGVRTIFDAGPLGYLQIVAHGHADALSVAYSDGSLELVGDPGTGTYFGDPAHRRAFRSTTGHATVSVDGLDQAEYGGPFLWLHHPAVRLVEADAERGTAVGEIVTATGEPGLVHRRAVAALPNGAVLVYDRIDAQSAHRYTQSWPLDPSLDVVQHGPSVFEGRLDGRSRLLVAFAAASLRSAAEPSVGAVTTGSWSRRLEQIEPASVLRAECLGDGRTELVALLIATRGQQSADPGLALHADDGSAVATFATDGSWRVRFDLDDPVRRVEVTSL